ncbi:MAG: hypothetical protein K2W85_10450 [Phycisphaerales bacterium]|nr:hypothetical protein [Phycisphaerales bacterium]
MLIFPILASIVWAAAMHWRRQWPSFVIVTLTVIGLLLVAMIMRAWADHMPDAARIFTGVVLWPYLLLTGTVGYYIACLPRPPKPHECQSCRYDLSALAPKGLKCPECGTTYRGPGSEHAPEPAPLTPIRHGPVKARRTL